MENETVRLAVLAILRIGTAATVNLTIDEQMPACRVWTADQATLQSCRDKEPAMSHHHPDKPDPIAASFAGGAFRGQYIQPQFFENPPPIVFSPMRGYPVAIDDGPKVALGA